MVSLDKPLRNQLERTVKDARDVAEAAARATIDHLGVGEGSAPGHLSAEERELRKRLRIHGYQLGDQRDSKSTNPLVGKQETDRLVEEVAYEHWHRMLFARFLAENNLLMYPDPTEPVAVSIQECDDLAPDEGARNGWELAARFAAKMLPEIFRTDSPVFQVDLPPEGQQELQRLLAELPVEVFQASDSLGWVYQFWQAKRKDEVNASEVKIGARELPAVTQLFTEDYMVAFLLDNTLGAWWAGKRLTAADLAGAKSEQELRTKAALPGLPLEYLRFVRTGEENPTNDENPTNPSDQPYRPAAGTFPGWPKTAAEIRVLDPCMGSGHFLVFALPMLAALRTAEEGLSPPAAVDAVLRDNLFGLEIDPRCAQIAAFNLALTAWRMTGFHPLPPLNLACTGIGPQATEDEWVALAKQSGQPITVLSRQPIENGLRNLHALFSDAPTLGSLIDPNQLPSDMFAADYETLHPYLAAALSAEHAEDVHERAVAAAGMVKAAELLAGEYALVITNVPYLKRGNQEEPLLSHCKTQFPNSRACLSTTFIDRCFRFCCREGSLAAVVPQPWLFLQSYKTFRKTLLEVHSWNILARLGHSAFETISGHVVDVVLLTFTSQGSGRQGRFVDCESRKTPSEKAVGIRSDRLVTFDQTQQLTHPESRVVFGTLSSGDLINAFASSVHGQGSFDDPSFVRQFWEMPGLLDGWIFQQTSSNSARMDTGLENVFLWEDGAGRLARMMGIKADAGYTTGKWKAGQRAWGKTGVAVSGMGQLYVNRYCGQSFDTNVAVIYAEREATFLPLWCYCTSPTFIENVRKIDRKPKVTPNTFGKVPFDLAHWQQVAAEKYPNGLPEPESDDPTQWLFHGRPEQSTSPLHVAVARLLGYRWPAELDDQMRLSHRARELVRRCDELLPLADDDGLVCIPAVRGEATAADRLLNLLAKTYGSAWNTDTFNRLLKEAGYAGKTLDTWLRDGVFAQHCELFHQRPFVWQIWDGLRDGFSILVNYHRLDRKNLETLLYTYLGDWIARQKQDQAARIDGAEERLAAALALQKKLELIRDGQSPHDIFVRWKPLHEQPIGWEPDLNDGVRMNIRPFLSVPDVRVKGAGALRGKPKIKWGKDRGKEPQRPKEESPWFWGWDGSEDFEGGSAFIGERFNDCHYTIAFKQSARARKNSNA